jgi:CO dehydrogenase/acetyl-CoA synthase beta subunit
MGKCAAAETSTAETSTVETSKAEFSVIVYDEVTGEEYRVVVANQKDTMWSTVNKECSERARRAKKITYGGMEIFETQTWEQLGIADDATVIVETEKKKKQETV